MELPEAIDFLQQMYEESKDDAVRRVIRIRLLDLSAAARRPDMVRQQLRGLILGE